MLTPLYCEFAIHLACPIRVLRGWWGLSTYVWRWACIFGSDAVTSNKKGGGGRSKGAANSHVRLLSALTRVRTLCSISWIGLGVVTNKEEASYHMVGMSTTSTEGWVQTTLAHACSLSAPPGWATAVDGQVGVYFALSKASLIGSGSIRPNFWYTRVDEILDRSEKDSKGFSLGNLAKSVHLDGRGDGAAADGELVSIV